eukprot:TRINITY_DN63964_c0_g1_i1.p1 TRINITY_DN63964_c0_g1~~TRINITY_DN63964_c0_g1_i1.p1  ORF type:complete len:367 (-),score=32.44 TRINITY_DN63964_c0_g1_i1:179-1279(-)
MVENFRSIVNAQHLAHRYLGPPAEYYWLLCWNNEPLLYGFVWASALVCLCATTLITLSHIRSLRRAPISMQRVHYIRISCLPFMFSVMSFITVAIPRAYQPAHILQLQYEALTLYGLGNLFFFFLALKARRSAHNGNDSLRAGQAVLRALKELGCRKHFATPPVCCLWYPCYARHYLKAKHMICMQWLIWQYIAIAPALSVVYLCIEISFDEQTFMTIHSYVRILNKLCAVLALWGLFVLNCATHEFLHEWHTHRKFWAYKLLLLLGLFQEKVVDIITERWEIVSCLSWEGYSGPNTHLTIVWCAWLCLVEAIGGALFMRWAFLASEILHFREIELADVEVIMELEQSKLDERQQSSSSEAEDETE